MATPRVTNRYPRHAERLAPETLREFLMEPIPARLRRKKGNAKLRLCDLDESAWERFSEETLVKLAAMIIDRVGTYHARKAFQHRHFPRPLRSLKLEDLRLENRTRRFSF